MAIFRYIIYCLASIFQSYIQIGKGTNSISDEGIVCVTIEYHVSN